MRHAETFPLPVTTPLSTAAAPAAGPGSRRAGRPGRARRACVTLALIWAFTLALLAPAALTPGRAAAAPVTDAAATPTGVIAFPSTGHAIRTPAFVTFFTAYGGVQTFGYPLSDEIWENGHQVQYFERQRFEYHPENAGTDSLVELGRLGVEYSRAQQPFATVAPFASTPTQTYIAQTQHSVAEPFLSYWQTHGGVRILGYPISEPVSENGQQVQYFERARFELHPENAGSPYYVLLSLLGKQCYQQRYQATAFSAGAAAPVAAPAAPAPALLSAMEDRLLQQINAARVQGGLGAVALDPRIIALARDRSADMANRGYFDHHTPDGLTFLDMLRTRSIPYRMAGEIIAQNNYPAAQTVDQAFQGYWHSPEHHDIIMMGNWTRAGVGEAVDGRGMYYYTVLFLQPAN